MYEYLGMTARAYVARGLALKRAVELGGTEVGVGGPPPEGESTSPSPLPTKKPKRRSVCIIDDMALFWNRFWYALNSDIGRQNWRFVWTGRIE